MTRLRQRVLHGLNLGDGWSQLARYYDSWRYCGLSLGDGDQGDVHRLYDAARLARVGESIMAPERLQLLYVLSDQRLVVLDSTVLASTRVGLLQLLLPPAPLLIVLVLYVCVLPDPHLKALVCS